MGKAVGLVMESLGWIAFALNVWGNLALTEKGVRGWLIRIASNLVWMPYGIWTHAWALSANHLLFLGINVYGWVKWNPRRSFEARVCSALGWSEIRPDDAVNCIRAMVENASEFER